MNDDSASALPGMPRDEKGPVFCKPWEAKAFAMVLRLHERGVVTWREWAQVPAHEIGAAAAAERTPHGEPIELRSDDFPAPAQAPSPR
jgi:hypothetical protein